jgi:hypothetical protein
MRLPELIAALAREGEVLRWDLNQEWYEVIDGPRFEERYNALRCRRERRKEEAVYRPFARMHTYFTLMRGEKWAGTGSAFRPRSKASDKDPQSLADPWALPTPPFPAITQTSPAPSHTAGHAPAPAPHPLGPKQDGGAPPPLLEADRISVTLGARGAAGRVRCTLQHFLDVTGAGELYNRSAAGDRGAAAARLSAPDAGRAAAGCAAESTPPGSEWSSSACSPDWSPPEGEGHGGGGALLQDEDIARIVGGLWDENSLGDQAYWFPRRAGEAPLGNGAIARLAGGALTRAPAAAGEAGMLMVVSDRNAKWKGEPLPSPEEEGLGHWCAFLGQVREIARWAGERDSMGGGQVREVRWVGGEVRRVG